MLGGIFGKIFGGGGEQAATTSVATEAAPQAATYADTTPTWGGASSGATGNTFNDYMQKNSGAINMGVGIANRNADAPGTHLQTDRLLSIAGMVASIWTGGAAGLATKLATDAAGKKLQGG